MTTSFAHIRIAPELKEQARVVLKGCGLNMSDAVRLFLEQVVARQGLPFDATTPNATTQAAMREAREISARWDGGNRTLDELLDDLEAKG